MYNRLKKRHEDVGSAYQSIKKQHDELAANLDQREAELEEANKDAEELADLVRVKEGVIKDLQASLTARKNQVAKLQGELRQMTPATTDTTTDTTTANRVSTHSLADIHSRYSKVLTTVQQHRCSMANAFRIASCPRSTVRDFVAIAELQIVDARDHDLVIRDHQGSSVKEVEMACRAA